MRTVIFFFVLLVCLGACRGVVETTPALLRVPAEARDVITTEEANGATSQTVFSISAKNAEIAIVDELQRQLEGHDFTRCDSGQGGWQEIVAHEQGQRVVKTRLVRFFKGVDAGRVAMLAGEQHCKVASEPCEQTFSVRVSDIPESIPDRAHYVAQLCK